MSTSISFILCSVYYVKFMEQVLKQVLINRKKDDELIIVINKEDYDDYPSSFLKQFDLVIKNSSLGIAKSRNIGLKNSRHEIIAYLDNDSLIPDNWRENLNTLNEFSNIALVQCHTKAINKKNYLNNLIYNRYIMFDTAGSIIRKSAALDVGGFDETFIRSEDMDLATKLYFAGWDLSFSDKEVTDLETDNMIRNLKNSIISSKYEAKIMAKVNIKYFGSLRVLLLKIFRDYKNVLRMKRFRLFYTYYLLKKNKETSPYKLKTRKKEVILFYENTLYRLNQEVRLIFLDGRIQLSSLKHRGCTATLSTKNIEVKNSNKIYIKLTHFDEEKINEKLLTKV